MTLEDSITRPVSLAEHPFVARLSRLMRLDAGDLRALEHIIESDRLVKPITMTQSLPRWQALCALSPRSHVGRRCRWFGMLRGSQVLQQDI